MSLRSFSRLCLTLGARRSIVLSPSASKRFYVQVRAVHRLLERSLASHQHGLALQQRRSFSSKPEGGSGDDKKSKESGSSSDPKSDDDRPDFGDWWPKALAISLCSTMASFLVYRMLNLEDDVNGPTVSWNEFYHDMLAKGEVESIALRPGADYVIIRLAPGAIVKGHPSPRRLYFLRISSLEHFEGKLQEAEKQLGVLPGSTPLVYSRSETGSVVALVITLAITAWLFSAMRGKGGTKGGMDIFSQMGRAKFTMVDHTIASSKPNVRFSDVAGCHGAKVEIGEFIDYLQDSEKYKKLGAKYPKGVLLTGPPGCGKTMLAKAVAAEAQVPFLAMAGSEFIEMIGGLGAKRVRSLFQEARKRSPCIIYIDEIDAIGRKRSDSRMGGDNSEEDQTLNQLLVEMDGLSSKEGVIMLASTNRAEVLDQALLRPGRLDRHILIDLPNLAERIEIYEKHLASIVLDQVPSAYSKRLAQLTPGFSGADIANVCNEAALHAARLEKRCVSSDDIDYAVERVVGGTEKKTHAMTPEERRRVAVHECGHAIVSWLMKSTGDLLKISIVPRTKGALGMARYIPNDQKLYTTEDLFEQICMALGGRAAEVVVYGQPSTGAEDDLKKVTEIAKAIVERYGMDSGIGTLSYDDRRPYSKKLANLMDLRASRIVQTAFDTAVSLVKANKEKLKLLTEELVRKEVLERSDVEAILGPRPQKKISLS